MTKRQRSNWCAHCRRNCEHDPTRLHTPTRDAYHRNTRQKAKHAVDAMTSMKSTEHLMSCKYGAVGVQPQNGMTLGNAHKMIHKTHANENNFDHKNDDQETERNQRHRTRRQTHRQTPNNLKSRTNSNPNETLAGQRLSATINKKTRAKTETTDCGGGRGVRLFFPQLFLPPKCWIPVCS